MKHFFYILSTILLLCATQQTWAQSPTDPALGFNVFVKNGATLVTNETEGPVAVGGDLTIGGSYQVSTNQIGTFQVNGVNVTLVVGGKLIYQSGNSLQVDHSGYAKIGDSTGSHVWYTDQNNTYSPIRVTNGTNYNSSPRLELQVHANDPGLNASATNNPIFQSNLIDFNTAFTTMQATSTSLSACTDNTILTTSNGTPIAHTNLPSQVKIKLQPGINTLNLTGADMNNVNNFIYDNQQPDANHILVINVNAPGTFNWNAWTSGGFGGQSNCSYVLYNFYNTTSLNIQGNGALEGTLFAPYADITKTSNNSNIEGQVIGLSYYHSGGENHYAVFTPAVGGCGVTASPTVAAFSINDTTQCLSGNSFSFTNTSTGTAPFTYSWDFGDGTTDTAANPTKTYSAAGNYTVTMIANGAGGADTTTQLVTVSANPATPGAFTASSSIAFQGQVNVTYTVPSDTGVTYNWSYTGSGATFNGTGNSVTVTFSTSATSGTIKVTETSAHGCGVSNARSIPVTVKPYETWSCGATNNWNDANNWDGGFVPYSTISAYIPANSTCQPNVSNNLTLNNLTVKGGSTINIQVNNTLNVNGNVELDGNVTGGYLNLSGTDAQNLTGIGNVDNLSLNNPNGASIQVADTIHIVKTYKPGVGTLTTNGGLELLSDSSTTACILGTATGCNYIAGDVICDKYLHGGRRAWRFLGHPYNTSIALNQLTPYIDITGLGGAANGFTPTNTNNPSAFWYNPETGNGSSVDDSTGWIAFTNTDGVDTNSWQPTQGLRVFIRGSLGQGLCCSIGYTPDPVTIKTHGPINECDVVVDCKTNSNYGYNFIGNPYPCNIDLSQATRGNAIGANFCVWDPNQGTQGAYVEQPFNISYILPAYSAFTTTCSNNSGKTITFHESDKTSSAASGSPFKTTSGFGNNVIQLHIMSNNDSVSWDRLLLFFNDQAASGTDELDGNKFSNPDLDFYSFSADNNQLGVDQRPLVDGQVIKLGLTTDVPQAYAIRVDDYDIPTGAQIYLHDKYLNVVQPLTQGMHYDFSVTSDVASQGDNRFELNVNYTTGIANVNSNEMRVDMFPNPASDIFNISFQAPEQGNTTVTVSNVIGQQVIAQNAGNMKSGLIKIPVQQLAAGVYMVTFKCGNLSYTQRLVKQ